MIIRLRMTKRGRVFFQVFSDSKTASAAGVTDAALKPVALSMARELERFLSGAGCSLGEVVFTGKLISGCILVKYHNRIAADDVTDWQSFKQWCGDKAAQLETWTRESLIEAACS